MRRRQHYDKDYLAGTLNSRTLNGNPKERPYGYDRKELSLRKGMYLRLK